LSANPSSILAPTVKLPRPAFASSQKARRGRRADDGNERKAEMITPMTSTDPLVEALATRLRLIDLVAWQRIATWAEQSELSFEDLRLLLAIAFKMDDLPTTVSELADLAGLPLDVAYPATGRLRGRGYLREERRQYALSQAGQALVAELDAAHREGIQAYVNQLDRDERRRLLSAFANPR
jgi:DNA-binding MarR family transcriptional regulator